MIDDTCGLDKQNLTPSDSGDLNPLVACVSKSSVLGIAVCDAQLRYVSVNKTLAAMHGIPPEAHIGKTVREVIGHVASTVEPRLRSVLFTGQSILNVEIRGELPARDEQGYWIANYFPLRDSAGEVKQVGVLLIDVTRLRKFEQCLLALMGNLPRIRDQVFCAGLPDRTENDRAESLNGSIEMLENCVREIRKVSQFLQPSWVLSSIAHLAAQQQVSLPDGVLTLHKEPPSDKHSSSPFGEKGVMQLSPRERETLRLLAQGKSNKEIAAAWGISVKTVETYRARVMVKLDYHSMSDLVRYAVRSRLVEA